MVEVTVAAIEAQADRNRLGREDEETEADVAAALQRLIRLARGHRVTAGQVHPEGVVLDAARLRGLLGLVVLRRRLRRRLGGRRRVGRRRRSIRRRISRRRLLIVRWRLLIVRRRLLLIVRRRLLVI